MHRNISLTPTRVLLALILSAGLMLAAGCPQPGGGGNNGGGTGGGGMGGGGTGGGGTTVGQVTANAGPDQTVEDGVTVTLAGSGSDSTGAAVTFLWTQVSGPTVTLTGANEATATFTAPQQSTTLTFNLQVSSTNGQANDQTTLTVNAAPVLFVVNRAGNSVDRFRASATLNGNVAPQGRIAGTAALVGPTSPVIDKNGGLLVTNADGNSVAGFPAALTFNGVNADRFVKGAATLLNDPEGAAYDATNDLLFVANFNAFPSTVTVYSGASTSSFNGNIAPTHTFSSILAIVNPRALALSSTGELYSVNAGAQNIGVFANAAALNGQVNASRTITSTEFENKVLLDAFLDNANRLLVIDSSKNRVLTFENASSLGLNSTPSAILTIPNASTLNGIVVDANGTGYVTDSGLNAIYIYENIAQVNGAVAPPRKVAGLNTQLAQPWHMVLIQP